VKLTYVIEVDYHVPMYAEEALWIEHGLEASHTLPENMRRVSYVEPYIFSSRLHPLNVIDPYKHDGFAGLDGQSLQKLRRGLAVEFTWPIDNSQICSEATNSRFSQI
jgi:hypothetical protein